MSSKTPYRFNEIDLNNIIYTELTHITGRDHPSGLFISNKYYGYIEIKDGTTIILYTREETYNLLMEQEEIEIIEIPYLFSVKTFEEI
jgi:hypothetical protein